MINKTLKSFWLAVAFHPVGDGVGLTVQIGAEVEGLILVDGADP